MEKKQLFTSKIFKQISLLFGLCSILIMVISNLKIDQYVKQYTIPMIILLISYIFMIRKIDIVSNKKAYFYLIPICTILFSNLIIDIDFSNKYLNLLIVPILLSIFFLTLTNENYTLNHFTKYFFSLFPSKLFYNLQYLKLIFTKKEKNSNLGNIILGCVIGIPIALIILLLLSSADMYFSTFISKIIESILDILNLEKSISNILILVCSFILLFSIFVNIIYCKRNNITFEEKEKKNINTSISSTVLTIINLVFILFLISEISKLTVNFLHLPIEYTYAKYAREGFFQLLGVTLINISIIIYYLYKTDATTTNKKMKNLILILVGFSILLIFNSYYRMFLYINAYKFTVLRLQVILFLTMELILFLLLMKKIIQKINSNESFTYMIIIISTYILNIYLCSKPVIELINKII